MLGFESEAVVAAASTPEAPAGASMEESAGAESGGLAAGWVEKLDPGSGRAYFVNSLTGEKTWKRSDALAAAGAACFPP